MQNETKFEQFNNKLLEQVQVLRDNNNVPRIESFPTLYNAGERISHATNELFKNMFEECSLDEKRVAITTLMMSDSDFGMRVLATAKEQSSNPDINRVIANNDSAMAVVSELFEGLANGTEETKKVIDDILLTGMTRYIGGLFPDSCEYNFEAIDRFVSYISTIDGGTLENACQNVDKMFVTPLENKAMFRNDMSDEINQLINNAGDDLEYKNLLSTINDEIFIMADPTVLSYSTTIAETMGNLSVEVVADYEGEQLASIPRLASVNSQMHRERNSHIINLDANEANVRKEMFDYCCDNRISYGDEFLEKVQEFYELAKNNGFLDNEVNGKSSTGITKIIESQKALREAIRGGDKNAIKAAYENYRRVEQVTDRLIEIATSLDNSNVILANQSATRNSAIPSKYRDDYKSVSKMNGLFSMVNSAHTAHVNPIEVLKRPLTGAAQMINLAYERSPGKAFMETHTPLEIIKDLSYGASDRSIIFKSDLNMQMFGADVERAMHGVYMVHPNRNDISFFQGLVNLSVLGPATRDTGIAINFSLQRDGEAFINNLLIVRPEDRRMRSLIGERDLTINFMTASALKPLNRVEYLNEHPETGEDVARRCYETLEGLSRPEYSGRYTPMIKKSITLAARDLLNSDAKIAKATKVMLEAIRDDKVAELSEQDVMCYKALQNVNEAIAKNPLEAGQEAVTRAVSNLVAIKNTYDSKGWFAKWFFPSVRRLKDTIDFSIDSLVEKGVDRATLEAQIEGMQIIENNGDVAPLAEEEQNQVLDNSREQIEVSNREISNEIAPNNDVPVENNNEQAELTHTNNH